MPGPSTFIDQVTSGLGDILGFNGQQPTAALGFDINKFRANMAVYGVEPTNLFLVTLDTSLNNDPRMENIINRNIHFFCHRVNLPGKNIITEDNIPNGIGPVERFAHNAVNTDIETSIIGDARGHMIKLFRDWTEFIVQTDTNQENLPGYYKTRYKDSYVATLSIYVFNPQSYNIIKYEFQEVFPYVVGQTAMAWADQNDFMSFDVGFYYTNYKMTFNEIPDSNDYSNDLSLLQKALLLGTAVSTVLPNRTPNSVADWINIVNNANLVAPTVSNVFTK